jgi:Bacterial Ig-like domain/Metallo-peptidase family M12B Reprolysin-like/IPT/TIG domain
MGTAIQYAQQSTMRKRAPWSLLFKRSSELLLVLAVYCFCVMLSVPVAQAQVTANTPVFGPQTYTRTTGAPNEYTTTFTAPPWIVSPFNLHIVNGDASGKNRISSATIALNGVQIAGPSDFNQNVATIDRSVTLQATNTLQVTLASKPGSYLTINVYGTNGDHTAPQIKIVTPAGGSYINTASPNIEVTYSDPVGTGEPGASGVNVSTIKATLDGVDRTSLFTVRSGDASATIPANLALSAGAHTLVFSLQDKAGNQATATSQFTVDLGVPRIQIVQPVLGAYLNTTTPTVSVQYSDSFGVNLSSLKVLINGVDETPLFTKTNTGATATLPAGNALPQGANQVVAQIQNLAGTQATASTSFNIDTTAPVISFAHPTPNSYHGSSTVEIMVQYSDDQALDTSTLRVTLDGAAISTTITPTSASGVASAVANGAHLLVGTVKDLAGNSATSQITFYVDTTVPTIHVSQPAPNAIVSSSTPQVSIDYSDITGVNTSTLKVFVNGADATSLFSVGASSATGHLSGAFSLPDGQNTIIAQVANFAGTLGTATSTFIIDTTPPTLAFQAPPARTNSNTPTVTLSYSDSGSGVNPFSLTVAVDGVDVSALIAPGASAATGVLQLTPPLSDGTHLLSSTITDRAGNKSQPATLSFVVDTIPPVVSFTVPANNSFLNNPTPSIILQYSDGTGTGVATSSIQILLQQGTNPPTDITSYFQIGPQQATGAIPAAVGLNDGTYVLSAVVNDLVGNSGGARATFVVDTVAPTGSIQSPAAAAILNVPVVPVVLVYQDDRSGIDTSKLVLTVDGVNQTGVLTIGPTQATGTLPALPDGVHTIQLIVVDRSGNSAAATSQTFTTDTIAPTIIASVAPVPNSAGWNNNNVTVTFTCSDAGSGVQTCPSPVVVSTEGANQSTCGQAVDAAGNTSAPVCATLNIDKTPPTITASISPAPNANGINTSTPVTVSFTCSDALSGIAVCPSPISVTTTGLSQVFGGTAADKAGNTATANVTLNIQTVAPTPPSITVSISPAPNAKGWNNSTVTVSFVCAAATYPLATCPAPVVVSTEGANQSICGKAIDNTGLSATACASVSLDRTPPTITASASPAPLANTWNTTPVTVTFTCADSLSGVATCPPAQTISTDGFHQVVSGTATDVAGNTSAPAQLTLNIDQTPPSILQFTAPSQLAPGQSGTATVNATDNIGVASVVIQLNGATVATLTTVPYTTTFTAPTTANAGDTLTLTASVFDAAGNVNSSARGIQVVPAGVVTGQVLSDATGLPFTGAAVQVLGATAQDTSDNSGRYSIASNSAHLFLSISSTANATTGAPAMVSVEREVFLKAGVGTVPVDARMTQIAAAIPINSAGGSLKNGSITVSVAPGAVSSATNFHLTSLSQQGLPGLSPLGWSPVAAFDLRADTSTSASFTASLTQLPNSVALHLVRYDYNSHSWLMVTPNLGAVSGALTIPVPSVGSFAFVTPDGGNTSLTVPSAGQALSGVSMVTLPAGAAATGVLNPPSVSPTGGTSAATLTLQSSVPLPSGTVIQAKVQDTYSLVSGKHLSQAPRLEDIILYQFAAPTGAAAAATFPVTPAQTFQPGKLASGDVHLDILSGRESVRGQVGGSDSVSVTGGDATLTVAAGSLPQDTAISVAPEGVDTFLPSTATLLPLAEYNIDLSGQILLSAAQLSVAAGSAKTGDTLVLAQIQRIQGAPYLVVVSLAQVTGSNLVTQAAPGLSGITQGGDYVFYKLTSPTGYVSGTVNASTGPVPALVQTDGLPFVAFSSSAGSYVIVALAGPVSLTASVPNTALSGTFTVQVTAGQTATANITLIGQTESATITPPNGAVGVPLTAEIDITAPDAFNPVSVTATSVTLIQNGQGTSTPVPVRFVFSLGNTRLSVFPLSALQPSTTYTLAASGLANVLGGLVAVPTATFTTKAITPPNFNPDALVFSMPDQNGNVQVSAPAGSFPSGSTILIVDQTNGVVLSLTVFNDGSVSGQFPATIDDVLSVTITAPDKTTTSFTRSQFVAPDGTTAVGSGGGTVTGPGNTGLIIPQGALSKGATFKLTPLDQTAFPVLPTFPGMIFGSGLHVDAPAMPVFSQEVKIAFPVPANAPSNAFYYVYRRLIDQSGNVYFDTIDHAFVQGTGANARVVTASPPFCGYRNSYGKAQKSASEVISSVFAPFVDFIVVMEIPVFDANQPGVASQGLIVGKVLQTVLPQPGQVGTTFLPIGGATVSLDSDTSRVATTDGTCGTFTLYDPQFGGGLRHLTVSYNGLQMKSTVNEVNPVANASAQDATFGPFGVTAGLEALYKNIGTVNFTFPPASPPPPPPQISIRLFTLDGNKHRVPATGILQTNTNIVIAFQSKLTLQSASVSGTQLTVSTPDSSDATDGQPERYLLDARVSGTYPLGTAGTFTITANALDPLSLNRITANLSFLVVAPGGNNASVITCTAAAPPPASPTSACDPPRVVGKSPAINATAVSPAIFPQVIFNEPVTHVPGNVVLADHTGTPVAVQLIGVRAPNPPNTNPIANPVQTSDVITSLTIQPLYGLKYNETYTLTLNAAGTNGCVDSNGKPAPAPAGSAVIIDQNQAPTGPLCLEPFPKPGDPPYRFTTFGPQELGGTSDQFAATRPVVIGKRAYAGTRLNSTVAALEIVDITDPSHPADNGPGPGTSFVGLPMDTAGQASSPVTGGPLVAVAAGQPATEFILPSNVWLFDVSNPDVPTRVGAVSATTSSTQDGELLRIFMKDQFLYTSTFLKGLQVIDLKQAVAEYQQTDPSTFGQAISTEGNGFATDTVVNTIPLFAKNYQNTPPVPDYVATMFDVKAADYVTAPAPAGSPAGAPGTTQTFIVATGRLPLVVADPLQAASSAVLYPASVGTAPNGQTSLDPSPLSLQVQNPDNSTSTYTLQAGRAVALGTLSSTDSQGNSTSKQVAVVVGSGVAPALPDGTPAQGVLVVVNMVTNTGDPQHLVKPAVLGLVGLSAPPTDVVIHGNLALVGTGRNKILLVNLVDPTHPVPAGEIDAPSGGIFGDRLAVTDSGLIVTSSFNSAFGGLHTSTLGITPQLSVSPSQLLMDVNGKSAQDVTIGYTILGDLSQVDGTQIQITDENDQVLFTSAVPVQPAGQIVWPQGQQITATPNEIGFRVRNSDGGVSLPFTAQTEISTGDQPTPVLSSVTPARVVTGTTGVQVTLSGRNFLPSTTVTFTRIDNQNVATYNPQFISTTKMVVQLPDAVMLQAIKFSIEVLNGTSNSNGLTFSVVPPGLPLGPTLNSINPTQLPSNTDPIDTWITLTGTNFISGDTLVKTDSIPDALDTQFISSTQIQALVPAGWLTGPTIVQIHLESASDSDLASQSLTLEVLNTVGATINPIGPELQSVNDGYIVPPSDTTQPTTVTITGDGFQPGAQVVAIADGVEQVLVTTVVSPSRIQAVVPKNLWSEKDLKVTFTATSAGLDQKTTAKIQKTRLTFSEAKNQGTCAGFFREHNGTVSSTNPERLYLMIPVVGSSNAKATTRGDDALKRKLVSLAVGDPSLATVVPSILGRKDEPLTVNGTGIWQSALVPLNGVLTLNNTKKTLATLNLQIMQRRTFSVVVHFVSELGGKDTPKSMPRPDKLNQFLQNLEANLNAIWGPQANVQFHLSDPGTLPEPIHYDLNSDDALQMEGNGVLPQPSDETYQIINSTVPNRNANFNPFDASGKETIVHVYFVKKFDNANKNVGGFVKRIRTRYVFVRDGFSGAYQGHIVAHEIGHALGLNHNNELNLSSVGVGLFDDDSYLAEPNALMAPGTNEQIGPHQCMIGYPHWLQLNQQNANIP